MRETGAAFAFVAGADVVIDRDGDYRHGLVAIQNDSKPVRKRILFQFKWWQIKTFRHKFLDFMKSLCQAKCKNSRTLEYLGHLYAAVQNLLQQQCYAGCEFLLIHRGSITRL